MSGRRRRDSYPLPWWQFVSGKNTEGLTPEQETALATDCFYGGVLVTLTGTFALYGTLVYLL